ncbi:MAG: hypothetical protein PV344_07990, partial [Anaplasma sp.]|nr:hypothetical protein [Anaplasma sp.]
DATFAFHSRSSSAFVRAFFCRRCFQQADDKCPKYCKRLNFREDLIFADFANCLRFAKYRSREQFGGNMSTLWNLHSIREN